MDKKPEQKKSEDKNIFDSLMSLFESKPSAAKASPQRPVSRGQYNAQEKSLADSSVNEFKKQQKKYEEGISKAQENKRELDKKVDRWVDASLWEK